MTAFWLLPLLGVSAVGFLGLLFTPWGTSVFGFLTGSRVGRYLALCGVAAVALAIAFLRAFNAGKASEAAKVAAANAKAIEHRHQVNIKVRSMDSKSVKRELSKWSPK